MNWFKGLARVAGGRLPIGYYGLVALAAIAPLPSETRPISALPKAFASLKACPVEVKPMVDLLLNDLPAYVNRVRWRQRNSAEGPPIERALVASFPIIGSPIPIADLESENPETLWQVTFSLLEQLPDPATLLQVERIYQLTLKRSGDRWMAIDLVYRSPDTGLSGEFVPGSETAVDRAVRLWLRDCNAIGLSNS